MEGPSTLRFNLQTSMDLSRMMRELTDLQRQVSTGSRANDLSGFSDTASSLLSAQSQKATAGAQSEALLQLKARFGVQASALDQVAKSTGTLAQAIRSALSANDGRSVDTEAQIAFSSVVSALNQTWNGQPLFAGERVGTQPVKIATLNQLASAAGPQDIFDEAQRPQVVDLGTGAPLKLADKASELATPLFNTFNQLKAMIDSSNGQLPAPLTEAQREQLMNIADQLDQNGATFTVAEARTGQLETRFDDERTRLQERSDLLTKQIGDQADADLGQVSVQINALLTQYQASAKTYSDISKLSLLNYL